MRPSSLPLLHRFPSLLSPSASSTSLTHSLTPLFLLPSRSYERLPRRPPPRHSHAHFQALAAQRRLIPPTPNQPPILVPHEPFHNPYFLRTLIPAPTPLPASLPPSASSPPDTADAAVTAAPSTPSPPPSVFSIVELNGAQYKVVEDDLIMSDRLPLDVGQRVRLTNVLLLGTVAHTLIGRPLVEGAWVECEVEEQSRTAKLLVFHKKRRKNHRKMRGHRDDVTILRVVQISTPDMLPLPSTTAALPAGEAAAA